MARVKQLLKVKLIALGIFILLISNNLSFIKKYYDDFSLELVNYDAQVTQQIGIGLVALFIPLSLIFIEEIRKQRKELHQFILEDVIKAKRFFVAYIGTLFLPILIKTEKKTAPLIFILWLLCILVLSNALIGIYNWGSFPDKRIKKFLNSKKAYSKSNTPRVFESVWKYYIPNRFDEEEYFLMMLRICSKLIESKRFTNSPTIPAQLIFDYHESFKRRNVNIFTYTENALKELLKFDYYIWLRWKDWMIKDKFKARSLYRAQGNLKSLITDVFEKSVQEETLFSVVDIFTEHFNNVKGTYIGRQLGFLGPRLIEHLVTNQSNIRYDFPDAWKITRKNFENQNPATHAWTVVIHEWFKDYWTNDRVELKQQKIRDVLECFFDNNEVDLKTVFALLLLTTQIPSRTIIYDWPTFIFVSMAEFSPENDQAENYAKQLGEREQNALALGKRMFPVFNDKGYRDRYLEEFSKLGSDKRVKYLSDVLKELGAS